MFNNPNDEDNPLATLIAYILVTAFLIFVGGFILSICWNLVFPILFGLPELGLIEGVALVGFLWIIRGVLKD